MGEGDRGQLVKSPETQDAPAANTALVSSYEGALVRQGEEDPEIVRLRSEIEATRIRIQASLEHLHEEFEEKLDWRGYVREHPWQVVGIAFAVGFFIGSG